MLSIKAMDRSIWVLIYGGLLVFVLGLAVSRTDGELGAITSSFGAVTAVIGFACFYIRSRMKAPDTDHAKNVKNAGLAKDNTNS